MENKNEAVKVSLSDEELSSISGGLVITKEILVDGKQQTVLLFGNSAFQTLRSDGKNSPGDNRDIFNGTPGTIL